MFYRLRVLAGLALLVFASALAPAVAEEQKLKKEELQQILAPIALYPDDLLSNVLMAATYPLEVVQAARWRQEPANAKLKDDALDKALEGKDWDPSVETLTRFPDVLKTMSDKLEWTQKLGDAFLAQQEEVMDAIQFLRQKADEAGNLTTNKQQKVTKEATPEKRTVYVIEPASPTVVYVPVYQPTVVYGPWWYPSYPPYYWRYPGATFVNGFFWGAGFALANHWWGWGHCDWRHGNIDIDINRYNKINVKGNKITSNKWEHNPAHRGAVPYKDKVSREKFGKTPRTREASEEFRGKDRGDIDRAKVEERLKDTDRGKVKDKVGQGVGDKAAGAAGDKVKDRVGDGGGAKIRDKAPDRPAAIDRAPTKDRAKAKKATPAALDIAKGSEVRRDSDRGRASIDRARSAGHNLGGARGGGGGGRAARGGGGGGGGRRR